MKTIWKLFLITASIQVFLACSKKEPIETDPVIVKVDGEDTTNVDTDPLKLIWQVPLAPGEELATSYYPQLIGEGKVMYTTFLANTFNGTFVCDRLNGTRIWDWDKNGETIIPSEQNKVSTIDHIFMSDHKTIYKVDINNGQSISEFESNQGYGILCKIGNFVYSVSLEEDRNTPIAFLKRTHIHSDRSEILYQLSTMDNDNLEPDFLPPALWINNEQDSILIFSNRNIDFGPTRKRLDLIGLNLKTRELVWSNKNAGPNGNGTLDLTVVHNNKIYLKDSEHVTCFDPTDGSIIWQSEAMSGHAHVPLLFAEGKLFVNPDGRDLYAMNPSTGDIIWHKTGNDAPASASNTLYYEGKLYTNGVTGSTSKIHCINPENGEIIWSMRSPNLEKYPSCGYSNQDGGLSIDPELGYLYITDGHFNQCFDLNP